MKKGIKTLHDIDSILYTLRNEITRIDKEIEKLFNKSQKNKQMQSKIIDSIAEIYFSQLEERKRDSKESAGIAKDIEIVLLEREKSYQQLLSDIKSYNKEIESLEIERKEAHDLLDKAAKKVIEKEHTVQSLLENDKKYQSQLKKTRDNKRIMIQAEQKALEAEQTRIEKGATYESDELFSYLWKRKYGTSEYKSSGIVKILDEWVDSLSGYSEHRVNYWTLLEIPKRLHQHAKNQKELYREDLEKLSKMEYAYAKKSGLVSLQEEERKRQEYVDSIDDKISHIEHMLSNALESRKKYLNDTDKYAIEIIEKINKALLQMSLPQLNRLAKYTLSSEDDRLVKEIDRLKKEAQQMQKEIDNHRVLYDAKIKQLHEVETLRSKFKYSRYDDVRSGFDNTKIIEDMLGGLLGGLFQSNILWDTLRRSQRHMDTGSWPDFGSGGFTSGSSSPWHFPQSRDGGTIFNLPDIGGFSSRNPIDSFSTGGGF